MRIKKTDVVAICMIVLSVWGLTACGGPGIRLSQPHADAKNFHPKRIGILPSDVGTYEEAKGQVDLIVAGNLAERKWFDHVVGGEAMNKLLQSDETFRKTVLDYTVKLKTVSFSDPELSQKIGDLAKVDAILLVNVDYWFYTKENDSNIAKVGLSVRLVETATGKAMWKAGHHFDESYTLFKPALPDVARKLVRQIFDEMPH